MSHTQTLKSVEVTGFRQADLDARAKRTGTNVDECVALYFHDPLVSMEDYGRLIEDAAARDDLIANCMGCAEGHPPRAKASGRGAGMNAQRLPIEWDGHAALSITDHQEIQQLRERSRPIPGRPGWRVDEDGREWYSAAWLNEVGE